MRELLTWLVVLLVSQAASAGVLSYDPALTNACAELFKQATWTETFLPSDCGVRQGNTVALGDKGSWAPAGWHATASSLPCNGYHASYVSGAAPFMYGEAKDCSVDASYRNIAHKQATQHLMKGIPTGLKLVAPARPAGYTLTAQVALSDMATAGFLRVGLMWHLRAPGGENLFVEFDAWDGPTTRSCADSRGTWTAYCPSAGSAVFERYRYWGANIAQGQWVTLSVGSTAVVEVLGWYRQDLDPTQLEIIQVYTAIEFKNSWGILQTRRLVLSD